MSQRLLSGLLTAAALGLAGILCVAPAAAIDLDGVKITPSVGYQGEFDDNIFRAKDNKKSDYVNHILPGLKIEATPGNSELEAHARARGQEDIPMADPVKLQGIMTLIMVGLLVIMLVAAVAISTVAVAGVVYPLLAGRPAANPKR